ncbi:MAG: LysM peptidoglycan-binding domain-containing protein, partial [Thermacetogeniaceae bacterium]
MDLFLLSCKRQLQRTKECVNGERLREAARALAEAAWGIYKGIPSWWEDRWQWMRGSLAEGICAVASAVRDWKAGKNRRMPDFLKKPGFYAAVVSGFLLLYGNFYLMQNRLAYAVCFQGRDIALVPSPRQGEQLLREVQRELEERLGQRVYLPAEPTFRACSVARRDVGSPGQLRSAFYGLPWLTEGVEIVIDGEPALVLEDRDAAQRVLERLKREYAEKLDGEEIESVEFVEKVALRARPVQVKEISGEEDALSLLRDGRAQVVKYRVKEGDSLWSIARAHGLLVDDLLQANPGLTERLDIDQEINLAAVKPLLCVRTVSSSVVKEAIPCEVEVRLDSSLRRGSTRVIRSGEDGEREVV